MEKTCPTARHVVGPDGDGRAFLRADRAAVPGPRLPHRARPAPRSRHLVHQVRPRRGADRRPDQPLQHDVRPLLHGREPGGLRPRAVLGGRQEDPRRRDHGQAAAADVGAVLRRRADALAPLPRRRRLRHARSATSRCSARPTACASRRSPSSRTEAKAAGLRLAYLQFDGIGNESERAPAVGNLFDVKLRPSRTCTPPASTSRWWSPSSTPSTTTRSARSSSSRSTTSTRSTPCRSSRCRSRDATRTSTTRRAAGSATRCRTWPQDVKRQTGVTEPLRDWYPLSASGPLSDFTDNLLGPGGAVGQPQVRLPPELRHRHAVPGERANPAGGAHLGGLRHRPAPRGLQGDQRPAPAAAGDGAAGGPRAGAQLPVRQGAERPQLLAHAEDRATGTPGTTWA